MKRARIVEMGALAVIAVFVAFGGHNLLVMLNGHKPWGWLIAAAGGVAAVLRRAEPAQNPGGGGLAAVLVPARWVFGSCIVAAEIALVFDLITLAAPQRAAGGN